MTDESSSDDSETLMTRRDAMATGGTVAATALLSKFGVQSVAAQTDNEPRINLGDNFYVDDVDGETLAVIDASDGSTAMEYDATAGEWTLPAVSTEEAQINDPTPVTSPGFTNEIPTVLRSNIKNDALALQLQDDTADRGEEGYAATLNYVAENGQVIGKLSGTNQNDMALYTRHYPLSDDAEGGGFVPRIFINAGSTNTELEFGSNNEGDTEIGLYSGPGNRTEQIFYDSGRNEAVSFDHNESADLFRFYDWVNADVVWYLDFTDGSLYFINRTIRFANAPLVGLREITNPTPSDLESQEWAWDATNSRWLYKDSDGTAHFFTADGTL